MAEMVQMLLVQVGSHRCGLLAGAVVEVLPAVRIVSLPGAPRVVEGVINLRGTVVPVFDLRQRFRLERRPLSPHDRLVIVTSASGTVALRADDALDVVTVPSDDIQSAAAVGSVRGDATGVVHLPDGLIVICEPTVFLSSDDAIALDDLLGACDVRSS